MNHIYRIVWNECTSTWVAVAETARSRSKGKGGVRTARKTFLAALSASGFGVTSALAELPATTVVPASGQTNAYISANGVPVVNIETANESGLSHNRYTRYDVEANGMVLNNGNNSQIARQSQLAGQVGSNLNLVQEARVILNEVVSTNRSTLAGFTEVLGGKADVIVANPNGLTCNGCGFINTDRVTLTTGTSNVAVDGSLTGFNVNRGDVLIEGLGANASTQQIFDIVARSVNVNGKINTATGGSLGITAGNNTWNYTSRSVTGSVSGSGAAPTFAFDSTALGGMYAGRIRIIATEAGVGVRMLGEAAASADDFTLSSAGKVEIQSAVSAARDASLTSTSASGSQDIFLNGADAKVSASRDLALTAASGQIKLTEGELYAANNLALTGATLSDVSTTAKTRFGGVNNSLVTTGAASINGGVWGAGSALSGTFDSFSIGASGATIYAGTTLGLSTTNNLSLATAAVRSTGNMALSASTGSISTAAGAAQGIQSTAGNLSLTAGNGLTNDGTITADAGSVTARINGTLTNSGTVHANTTLDIADKTGGNTQNVTNSGTLIADGSVTAKAASFTNQFGGTVQGTTGTTLTANNLSNAGTFIASNTAGQSGAFTLASLTNSGTLQSVENLVFNVSSTLDNTGKLLATNNLTVSAGASALALSNTNTGFIQAGNTLTITGSNATFNTQSGTVLGNTTGVTVASLNNSGTLQSNAGMSLAIGSGLTNSGVLLSKTSLSSTSGSLTNSGTLQADQGGTITTSALSNTGTLIASGSASHGATLNVGTLNNTGTGIIQSAQSLAVNLSGATLTNASKIIAADDLTLNSIGSGLTVTNQSGGYLQAGAGTGDTLTVGGTAVVLNNNASGNMLGDQLVFTLASLSNAGTIQGGVAVSTINTSGALSNSGTMTLATSGSGASNSGIAAASLDNSGTLQSAASMTLTITNLENNSGTLFAANNLTSNSGSLTNSGTLQANQRATITTGALTNTGYLAVSGTGYDGTLSVDTLSNTGAGVIRSAQNLAINLSGSTLTNASKIIANNDVTLNSTGSGLTVANQSGGYMQAGSSFGDTLTVGGAAVVLNNNAGGYLLGGQLAFTLTSLSNAGTIQGGAATTINATGALSNTGTLSLSTYAAGSGTITASTLSNTGTGVIQSVTDLTVNLSGSTLTNASKIIALDDLTLTSTGSALTITNQSGGYLQAGSAAGDTLTIGGTAVVLNNNASGNTIGDKLDFTLASLTNAGTVQGGSGASVINLGAGTLTNTGTLTLATSTGSGTVTADTINNSGTLQSNGWGAALNLATTLNNSGSLLTTGALTVRGTDSSYTVSDTGRMQSGGLMEVTGMNGGNGVDITVGGSGVMLGDSMNVNAGTLTVDNGGMVSTMGNMSVNVANLSFGGTTSRIVAANSGTGTATITLANGFSSPGAIHSGDTLNFYAPSIINSSTGGFSALNTLNVNATGGGLGNYGALYAGSQLTASATGDLRNYATTGTMDSSGSMTLSAGGTFTNNSTINATQDISINAPTVRNEIPGGVPVRVWSEPKWGAIAETGYTCNGDLCPDTPGDEWWYYRRDGSKSQAFESAIPNIKPQIIAGRNMNITGFSQAFNTGAVLSASSGTLSITGTGSFINDDLSLLTDNLSETWYTYKDWGLFKDVWHYNQGYNLVTSLSTAYSYGAGIFAGTLNASGFALHNQSSPWAASVTSRSPTGAGSSPLSGAANGASLSGAASGTSGAGGTSISGLASAAASSSGVSGTTSASGVPAISFGGLVITLPTNPNGYFVISQNPGSNYLVETNPLFNVGSNFVGSDYMAQRYGYNPDIIIKRLGDSNYEAHLIRQQLISQTGKNIINGYSNEAGQMKRLMDNAVTEGKQAGFVFGKALTPDQVANLNGDVVWMVETTVAGQKVLAPVVYLAASTKNSIEKGAVIAGENVNLNLTSVTNTGGTISGAKSLSITSIGDITNTSGTIKGGDVAIKSTEGSIKNETLVEGSGDATRYVTTIGKQGGITATGNLDLDAKKDITVKGAEVKAGGDASLTAGGNITFETVVNKTTNTTHSSSNNGLQSSNETTTTEKNIGSGLVSGGSLKLKSGGDTTIKGSNVSAGGDLDVNTGGDFKVLSVQDKTTTHSEKTTSGLGVGGGIGGTEKVTTDDFTGKNVGSALTVGGNAKVKSAGEMTLQGSDMSVAGNADIDAKKGVNVLDGLDEQRTTTKTETTTFLKTGSSGEAASGAASSSSAKSGQGSGKAEAQAEASGDADLKFSETTTTVNVSGSNTSVSSNLKVGGNLNVKTDGTLKVQGSNVEAGGDLAVDAKNVEVTAGRNETFSNTTTDRVSTGIYNEGKSEAKAGADSNAKGGNASGKAGASAEASGTTTIGARVEKEESTEYKLRNTGSTLKSGGNLSIKAKEDVTFVGSTAESGGDMNIDAKNITNKAAQDIEINTSSKTKHTMGVYIDGQVSAEAKANGSAGKLGNEPISGEAKGEAKADTSAGLRYKNEQESSTEGSVTQVTSGFKAGGSITRKATDTITDQGTQLEAGGNINQSAREIKEIEANNSKFSSKDSSSHDAKIGVGAGASAGAGGNVKGETETDASAGAGFRAKYEGEVKGDKEGSTTAVTSKYKAGGNINSKSEEKTTLIGTQFESKGDVNLEAGSLEFKAAKDTTNKSGTSHEMGAALKVDVVGKAGGSLEAEYKGSSESEKTSTARTGSVNAGGNLNIKTKGDASFEGTKLEAGGDASVKAGGTVDFKAARDTTENTSKSGGVSLELSASKGSKGGKLEGEYAQEDSASSKAQTGGIKSGGKLDVSAGKDANFEGAELKSKGDASVEAGGNANLKAAKDTETSTGFSVEGSVSGEKGSDGNKSGGSVGGSVEHADKAESKGTSIESGGKVAIKGKNVVDQEADIKAKDGAQVTGNVIKEKAENRDVAIGIDVAVSGEKESKSDDK